MRDPINVITVHQKQRGQLLGHLDSNPPQICTRRRIIPKLPKLSFTDSAPPPIDAHHNPVLIGAAPDQCIWKRVVKRAQDRFCFLYLQLIDRKPKARDSAFLQPASHQRKKLLGIKIHCPGDFRRWRFARDDVVLLRAGLQKKSPILEDRVHPGVAQRIRVINSRIEIGESEHFLRDVHHIDPLHAGFASKRIRRDAAPVTKKQHISGCGMECQRKVSEQSHVALIARTCGRH